MKTRLDKTEYALNLRDFTFCEGRQALLGTHVIGVVAVIHGHDAALEFPNAVDDLVEESAVVGNGDGRNLVVNEHLLEGSFRFHVQRWLVGLGV